MDNIYFPAEMIKPYYANLRDPAKGKAKVITTHSAGGAMFGLGPTAVQVLDSHGLLGPDIIISHPNRPQEGDGKLYQKSGARISNTPNTELQMGQIPVALREDHYENSSLGVDCHSWCSSSIPRQMQLLIQYARGERGKDLSSKGLWSRKTGYEVEQVFNLGTLGGAKACGLADEIGSLKEGMKADILVFDGSSPAMLGAAAENPVAAIVFHSSPSDIEMVLVNGEVRKENGRVVDVTVAPAPIAEKSVTRPGEVYKWADVGKKLLASRASIKAKMEPLDMKAGEDHGIQLQYMYVDGLLENMPK